MMKPRIYIACLWGVMALLALYNGIAHGYSLAWWLLAVLVPPLLVFVWWMSDRASLERRISRLEAKSEIGDERRVDAHTDQIKSDDKLQQIEQRVAMLELDNAGVMNPRFHREKISSIRGKSSAERIISGDQ